MSGGRDFLLLQINDALFPIGGYSHSYGLETYIQKGIVRDADTAEKYIWQNIRTNLLYNELLLIRLAWEYASEDNLEAILELEEIAEASRSQKEIREASRKLGSRFLKTTTGLDIQYASGSFLRYAEAAGERVCHPCAYGVFCFAAGIEKEPAVYHFLYSQISAMVTNCVKTIPLSQSIGQKLLNHMTGLFDETLGRLEELTESELCISAPGFAVRSMQHECLYSRIYMS